MLFVALVVLPLAIYLVVEERERSAANPNAPRWATRVLKSMKQHWWLLSAIIGAYTIQAARGRDSINSVAEAWIGLGLFVFVTLHTATLSVPRKDKSN